MATRLLMVKADGSVLVHSDGGSYKPLNWMSPPCTVVEGLDEHGRVEWLVEAKGGDSLRIVIEEIFSDASHELGVDPGLQKDGVEKHLQELLAEYPATLADGLSLVRREFPTAIGPVDLLCRDATAVLIDAEVSTSVHDGFSVDGGAPVDGPDVALQAARHVAVEIKRKASIDAVEQLTRYLELLNRDPLLKPVRGILAAQSIVPQARTLAEDRGIVCAVVDYDALRGMDNVEDRLF
jgi:RecB family endonuclease NucS